MIKKGQVVDHVNDDQMDDRYENYQLLDDMYNLINKRDIAKYERISIPPDLIRDLQSFLGMALPYEMICGKLEITPGHLRHLIRTRLPGYSLENKFEMNIPNIKFDLDLGCTQYQLGFKYGVDQATMSRLIAVYLPDYTQEKVTQRLIATIREKLQEGYSPMDVGRKLELKCPEVVYYYIKTHLPEFLPQLEQERKFREEQKLIMKQKIASMLDAKMKQVAIAKVLDLPVSNINAFIYHNMREYIGPASQKIDWDAIGPRIEELLQQNTQLGLIARDPSINISPAALTKYLKKHHPERYA